MDLTNYQNWLKIQNLSDKTIESYLVKLRNFFSRYSEFNQENINAYLLSFSEDKGTFNLSLATFKNYQTYLKSTKVFNEIEFPKYKTVPRVNKDLLTIDEIEKELLPYFPRLFDKHSQKYIFLFRFMVLSLMRRKEIINLKKKDIDLVNNKIFIYAGKGAKSRKMLLNKVLKDDLIKMMNNSKTDYVFDVSYSTIGYIFDQINNVLCYKKYITPHYLRRAGATYYSKYFSLKVIQEWLGHSDIATTSLYIGIDEKEVVNKFNKIKYKTG